MSVVVLVRHGESLWNRRQLLTGWSDPLLSGEGRGQAGRAGARLRAEQVVVDRVYTSLLTRSTATASIMLAAAGGRPVPVVADWRLNERHLGRLEGLTKAEVAETWGNEWRKRWRDDERAMPPALGVDDRRHPRHDPRYRHVPVAQLPGGERRHDLAVRVLDFWHERVVPDVEARRNVLVVSHLGPLRVLARHVGGAAGDEVPLPPWPNGVLRLCRLAPHPCCGPAVPAVPGSR